MSVAIDLRVLRLAMTVENGNEISGFDRNEECLMKIQQTWISKSDFRVWNFFRGERSFFLMEAELGLRYASSPILIDRWFGLVRFGLILVRSGLVLSCCRYLRA